MGAYAPDTGTPWYVWAILIVFGLCAVGGLISWAAQNNDRRKRGQPTESLGEFYDIPGNPVIPVGPEYHRVHGAGQCDHTGRSPGTAVPVLATRPPVGRAGRPARGGHQGQDRKDREVGQLLEDPLAAAGGSAVSQVSGRSWRQPVATLPR